jgi:hypothetical protein
MNAARRAASNAPVALPPRPTSARPERAAATIASRVPSSSPEQRAPTNPFASLKLEQTIEAKVSPQLLRLTRDELAMGGATQAYEVSEELMALAGRGRDELHSPTPAAMPARVSSVAVAPTSLPLEALVPSPEPEILVTSAFRRLAAPHPSPALALPSIPVAPAGSAFNWLTASVITYALLCCAYWLLG